MIEKHINRVSLMMQFEEGSLNFYSTIELFSDLIKSGLAWQLQGFYGRTADKLIDSGFISIVGDIDTKLVKMFEHQEF